MASGNQAGEPQGASLRSRAVPRSERSPNTIRESPALQWRPRAARNQSVSNNEVSTKKKERNTGACLGDRAVPPPRVGAPLEVGGLTRNLLTIEMSGQHSFFLKVAQTCLTLCDSMDCSPPGRLVCPWNSPGQNTGVGSCTILERIFPTQGSNPVLPQCRQVLRHLSHQGSPRSAGKAESQP